MYNIMDIREAQYVQVMCEYTYQYNGRKRTGIFGSKHGLLIGLLNRIFNNTPVITAGAGSKIRDGYLPA